MTRREAIPYMLDKGAYNVHHEKLVEYRSKFFISSTGHIRRTFEDGTIGEISHEYNKADYNDGWEPWEEPIEYVDGFTALKAMAENQGEKWQRMYMGIRQIYRIKSALEYRASDGWNNAFLSLVMLTEKVWHKYIPKDKKPTELDDIQ